MSNSPGSTTLRPSASTSCGFTPGSGRDGIASIGSWLLRELARTGLDARENAAPMPFADHFPFSVFGVPAVSFLRPNMDSGMRWQHHSAQDNLENVAVNELARVVSALAKVTRTLAAAPRLPFVVRPPDVGPLVAILVVESKGQ